MTQALSSTNCLHSWTEMEVDWIASTVAQSRHHWLSPATVTQVPQWHHSLPRGKILFSFLNQLCKCFSSCLITFISASGTSSSSGGERVKMSFSDAATWGPNKYMGGCPQMARNTTCPFSLKFYCTFKTTIWMSSSCKSGLLTSCYNLKTL